MRELKNIDPAKYRTRDEVNKIKAERDPIDNLRSYLISNNISTDSELKDIDRQIKDAISDAADFAISSDIPGDNELLTDIYS